MIGPWSCVWVLPWVWKYLRTVTQGSNFNRKRELARVVLFSVREMMGTDSISHSSSETGSVNMHWKTSEHE